MYDDTGENGSWALIPLGLFLIFLITFSLFPPTSLGAFVIVGKAFSLFTGLNTVSCVCVCVFCESTFVACVYIAGVILSLFYVVVVEKSRAEKVSRDSI